MIFIIEMLWKNDVFSDSIMERKKFMKLVMEVMDFLWCGGYCLVKIVQQIVLGCRKFYWRGDGEVDRYCVLFGDFFGFEVDEEEGWVLVWFIGLWGDEESVFVGYWWILYNCGFGIEECVDLECGEYCVFYVLLWG